MNRKSLMWQSVKQRCDYWKHDFMQKNVIYIVALSS